MAVLAASYPSSHVPSVASAYPISSPLLTPPSRMASMPSTTLASAVPMASAVPSTTAGLLPYGTSDRFFQYSGSPTVSNYPSSASVAPVPAQPVNGVRRAVSSPSLAAFAGPSRSSYVATAGTPSSDTTAYDRYATTPGGSYLGALPSQPPPTMAVAIAPQRTTRIEAYGGNSSRDYYSPRDYYDRYAIATVDDSALGNTSALATLSVDSPKSRKKAARAQRLYEDAVARRQRLSDKKESAAKHERDELEGVRREALLQQRARQRFYHMRDTRTHEEREEAMLKKREDRRNALRLERQRQEQLQYSECTFQPKIYTKREDREGSCRGRKSTGGRQVVRSSSCDAVLDRTPALQDDFHYAAYRSGPAQVQTLAKLDTAGSTKLQILLDKQLGLIRKLTNIDEEAQMARQSRAQAATPMSEIEVRDAEVQFYKKQLDVVHSLERLDMDILELPKVMLDALLAKGFRLGLGEGARQGLKSPREASRRAFAESPRNNLRIMRSSDIVREGQERFGQGVLVHERSFSSTP